MGPNKRDWQGPRQGAMRRFQGFRPAMRQTLGTGGKRGVFAFDRAELSP